MSGGRHPRIGIQWSGGVTLDPDAQAWVTAVEAADGQALEQGVKDAVNTFVVGCKADSLWAAMENVLLIMGARTLAGALRPLKGVAPANVNFVSGDYNRKTGILGDGTTKYLDTNVLSNSTGNISSFRHRATNITVGSAVALQFFGASHVANRQGDDTMQINAATGCPYRINNVATDTQISNLNIAGFMGVARPNNTQISVRQQSGNSTFSQQEFFAGDAINMYLFARNTQGVPNYGLVRSNFYSLGASLSLSVYQARVDALVAALAALPI